MFWRRSLRPFSRVELCSVYQTLLALRLGEAGAAPGAAQVWRRCGAVPHAQHRMYWVGCGGGWVGAVWWGARATLATLAWLPSPGGWLPSPSARVPARAPETRARLLLPPACPALLLPAPQGALRQRPGTIQGSGSPPVRPGGRRTRPVRRRAHLQRRCGLALCSHCALALGPALVPAAAFPVRGVHGMELRRWVSPALRRRWRARWAHWGWRRGALG